jgi:oligosaccharyltransferase complex subunit gamma
LRRFSKTRPNKPSFLYSSLLSLPSTQAEDLLELQNNSDTGVIELDADTFDRLIAGKARTFSVFIFANYEAYRRAGRLKLGLVNKEYELAAKTYAKAHAGRPTARKVFFARMEFETSEDLFRRLGVKGLPFLGCITPSLSIKSGSSVTIPEEDSLTTVDYPWMAETVVDFVYDKTGIKPGEVVRPPSITRRMAPIIGLIFLASIAIAVKIAYSLPILRRPEIYAAGALLIWWFAVSGGMHNIIRGVPFVGWDPRKKATMLFSSSTSSQLGFEGFFMGTLYTTIGMCVAGGISWVPSIHDEGGRRTAGYTLLAVAFLAMQMITGMHGWKTHVDAFWYFTGPFSFWLLVTLASSIYYFAYSSGDDDGQEEQQRGKGAGGQGQQPGSGLSSREGTPQPSSETGTPSGNRKQ